jgi:hypothetical protein
VTATGTETRTCRCGATVHRDDSDTWVDDEHFDVCEDTGDRHVPETTA